VDELTHEFAETADKSFLWWVGRDKASPNPKNVCRNMYSFLRRSFEDYCETAVKKGWTTFDICQNLAPNKGKGLDDTEQTQPFNLTTELPVIMEVIMSFSAETNNRDRPWAGSERIGQAWLLLLRHSGLRKGDSLKVDPDSLELKTISGKLQYVAIVQQEKTKDSSPTVRILIPKDAGDIIRKTPRLSRKYAFIPEGVNPDAARKDAEENMKWMYYKNNTATLFKRIGQLSGVPGVRAHRFRDTLAREIWVAFKKQGKGGMEAIRYITTRLGHKEGSDTAMKHYMAWLLEDQIEGDDIMFR
jgi:integrase